MRALFLSRLNKRLRGWIALSFLLISFLGTHWIGFAHGISHSGIQAQNLELSCADQETTAAHSSTSCHLLDALSLASFIASDVGSFISVSSTPNAFKSSSNSALARLQAGLYQSRAPPSFIL